MKRVDTAFSLRRAALRCAATVVATTMASLSYGAATDLSNFPLVSTTAAAVKPNIMLLLDTSRSMGRTHMPDEVETVTGTTSVGYKSSQCNMLYYDPGRTYLLPTQYDGSLFPAPPFTAAPYSGFGAFSNPLDPFYSAVDLITNTTDLSSQFVAFDARTLETVPLVLETPHAAYYYVYSGPETLNLATPPCTQPDTGVSAATPGGGNWNRVDVSLGSATDQANFAVWYSYYRTRLALVKSAASLAFSPLNDSKRVGFITVQPKDSPVSASINAIRYLSIADFDVPQKQAWYSKLFSQSAGGASPAREGLARVGRYYAGKTDGINHGMDGPDPLQYSCVQNFTIMTTDGYWNAQTETPGGGGVKIDGVTLVGQEDGDPTCGLADPYCPRPIFDGIGASIKVTTNKVNGYASSACAAPGFLRSTDHITTATSQMLKDTQTTQQRTLQYKEEKHQAVATVTQTTRTDTQVTQTTTQFAKDKHHATVEKYKVKESQDQTTMVREQFRLQTIQNVALTSQTQQVTTTFHQHTEQWNTATSQYVVTSTQYQQESFQYKYGATQKLRHTYRIVQLVGDDEVHVPISGACPALATCIVEEVFPAAASHSGAPYGPAPDPTGTCTASGGVNPTWVRTDCSDGPFAVPYGPVAGCAGTPDSGFPNYIFYRCDTVPPAPTYASFDGTCVDGAGSMDASFVWTYCFRPPANNTVTPIATCVVGPPASSGGPDWITTTCSQPPGPNNQPATASAPCVAGPPTVGAGFVTTTCTKVVDSTVDVAVCADDAGVLPPYFKVTCGAPAELSRVSVAAAGCVTATVGATSLTCETVAAGPYPVATAVAACAAGPTGVAGTPGFFETTCSNPAATNHSDFVPAAGCATVPAAGPPWISTICTEPINDTTFSDPGLCIFDDGTGAPYLHVTCTPATLMPPTFVDPATCPVGTDTVGPGPGFIVTHCVKFPISTGSFPPGTCPVDADPWVVVVCGDVETITPVASCVLGSTGTDDGIDFWTCVAPVGPNNAVTHPLSCTTAVGATSPPEYVDVACSGPVVLGVPSLVDPTTCATGPSGPPDNVVSTSCVTVGVSGPTGVPVCTPGLDGSGNYTACTYPAATNYAAKGVPFCAVGPPVTDASQVTTTCTKSDVSVFVPTATCVTLAAFAPDWIDYSCSTVPFETAKATDSCLVGGVAGASPFATTTACTPNPITPPTDTASCVASVGVDPTYIHTDCGLRSLTVNEPVAVCVDGTDGSGVKTTCSPGGGIGQKYSVTMTTTVTTQRYSGAIASGAPSTTITAGPTVDVDGICYPTPQVFVAQPPIDPVAFPGCVAWPCDVTTAVADGSLNSLADVAQYYYKTDLRPLMVDNAVKAGLGAEDDNAPHQHMTTFVIGLGVSGTLTYQPDYRLLSTLTGDFADIRTGAKSWPLWPDPTVDYTNPDNWNNPKSIDDFWHTAVDGRGKYFSANDPTSVIDGLGDALGEVAGQVASGAADGVSTLEPLPGNNFVFSTSYKTGPWFGDLEASLLNLTTGALITPPKWSAKALIDARVFANCDDRNIYLMRGSSPVTDFTWNTQKCPGGVPAGAPVTGLSAAEQAFFGTASIVTLSQYPLMTNGSGITVNQQASVANLANHYKLVNFLRGERGNEGFVSNSLTKLFRTRTSVLGDIVDSQPVYVKAPFASYADAGYDAFKLAKSGRTPMVYAGANDGMLHAFNAVVDPLVPASGQEAWAVIPSSVLPNLFKLADDNYKRDGHQFYVDGTPVVGDVNDAGTWKTILVGGLNHGGKGYYALDVTDPAVVPPPALWEFKQKNAPCPATSAAAVGNTSDCNLGFTYGKPVITKLTITGVDTWVVMFTSGYNNVNGVAGDGGGYLYVLNAISGAVLYKIPTGAGDAATPSGLAQINNYVDNVAVNNETLRAYGGDLLGNVWRFEFGGAPSAQLIGTAKDTGAVGQPITTRPELAELDGKPIVFVGTGKFLGDSDVTDTQQQSVYGITDPLTAGPVYGDLRGSLRHIPMTQTGSAVGATRSSGVCDAHCASTAGWMVDLPEAGERVNIDMKLVLGTLVVGTNVPEPVPCSVGGHSWFNYLDFRSGGAVSNAPRTDPTNPATAMVGQYLADSLIVGFNIVTLPPLPGDTNRRFSTLFHMSDTTHYNPPVPVADPIPQGKRISWREIAQ